jgi:predicted enzyme related to lactoylglutathione lyase
MDIRRIVPNISSEQMEKSREFYADFLGLKLVMDMQWILTFASISNPTAQISILQKDVSKTSDQDVTISIEVADVDISYAKAVSFGYKIIYPLTNEPWGVRRFGVEDPNGISLNIMCHIKAIDEREKK